ncbi:SMI1/KNR4 family protein, partial [Salmonella enterica]
MLEKIEFLGGEISPFKNTEKERALDDLLMITGRLPDDYRGFLYDYGGVVKFNCIVIFKGIEMSVFSSPPFFSPLSSFSFFLAFPKDYLLANAINTYKEYFKMLWIP